MLKARCSFNGNSLVALSVTCAHAQGSEDVVAAANVTVLPGAICPKCSTLTPLLAESYDAATGAVVAVAGKTTQLLITPYDDHGNVANVSAADMFAVGVAAGQLPGRRMLGAASNATVLQVCVPSSHNYCYQKLFCVPQ